MKINKDKHIVLDADVIIHFCKGGLIGQLPSIFPNKILIPDIVYKEALSHQYQIQIKNLFEYKFAEELKIKADLNIFKEYRKLVKMGLGKGESACMAYCKHNNDVIGSSNLRDIKKYCAENEIQFLTTMDFINTAYDIQMLSEAECDEFIYNVTSKGSRLPYSTLKEFRKNL